MHNKIFLTFISFITFLFIPSAVLAMQEAPPPTYYVFLLNNLEGIVTQREYKSPVPYELFYEGEGVVPSGGQKGILTDLNDKALTEFSYDLKEGNFEAYVPYFANAGRVKLFSQNNEVIYTYDLGDIAVCDFDKKCGSIVGETELSCPSDCVAQSSGEENSEVSTSSRLFPILISVLVIIGLILFGLIIYLVHKGVKGK